MARGAAPVGNNKVLLFDDAFTEEERGFTLTMNPAVQQRDPVLICDQPWEVGGLCGDSNASIMDDDGLYRLWYVVELIDAHSDNRSRDVVTADGKLDPKTLADLRSAGAKAQTAPDRAARRF